MTTVPEERVEEQEQSNGAGPITLGVVAISYNEEQDLPGFLEHLQDWVDEIVIVDDGSTDSSREIIAASSAPTRLVLSPRQEGEFFSHQRNKGIAASHSHWLLHMDIDERVSPDLAAEIISAIRAPGKDAYRYRRRNYFMHRPMKGGGWQRWNLVHLARRDALRFGGMFHEECQLNIPESGVGQLTGLMYHLNEDNLRKRFRKSDTYLEETLVALRDSGIRPRFITLLLRPLRVFAVKYFLHGGFKDGVPGLISALHSSIATFRAHALLWEEQHKVTRKHLEEMIKHDWDSQAENIKETLRNPP